MCRDDGRSGRERRRLLNGGGPIRDGSALLPRRLIVQGLSILLNP